MPTETPGKPVGPIGLVIFGATGDLTRRKLIPALYQLALAGRLPDDLSIIGFARRDWNKKEMRSALSEGVRKFARTLPVNDAKLKGLLDRIEYIPSVFEDAQGYSRLTSKLKDLGVENRLYYLATPPSAYEAIIENLGKAELSSAEAGWTRIIIEKPYGRDLESARQLDEKVHQVFREDQVYRIDHYLGKETVQNILVFRFANGIFEPLWDRRSIDCVQITVSETVGVGTRAGFYEKAGVIRDIFQNHIMQLLSLTAMEAPTTFSADAVRDEKVKVLKALRPATGKDALRNTFRAQYGAGALNGNRVRGYKQEEGVAKDSTTETFLAARLYIDNWRWADVPFYIRSGKRLPERKTEIVIQFKQVPLSLFGWQNMAGDAPNILVLNIQPEEGITLSFGAKVPGPENEIASVKMGFSYKSAFGSEPPEAYERLLMDSINGDATLFIRSDEVLAAWAFTTNILQAWQEQALKKLPDYKSGTWGPPLADEFIQRWGQHWHNP